MSNQRLRLAKYINKRQNYRAVFNEIRHDKQNKPEVLLTDVYPVYKNGKKVPLRSKPELKDQNGLQIAADHVWVKLNCIFLRLPTELLYGDQIQFSAVVKTYPIVRQNVVQKRQKLWQNGLHKADEVYQKYSEYKNTIEQDAYNAMKEAQKKAYQAYRQHLLTFQEMKNAQSEAYRDFKKLKQKAYQSMQAKQKRRIARAQKDIKQTDLVDYELTDLQDIQVISYNHHFDQFRIQYDADRFGDLAYTKFLAAHSMASVQGIDKLNEFNRGV